MSTPRPPDPGYHIPFVAGFNRGLVSWGFRSFSVEMFIGIGPDRHIEPAQIALRDEFSGD